MLYDLADDILYGAQAIADFLGCSTRRVYAMREAGHPLIKREPGVGITARKSELVAHFAPYYRAAIGGGGFICHLI